LLEAIRKANSDDPLKIREALASIKGFKGVTGEFAMDANGNAIKSAVILQMVGGRQKFVKAVSP
jgi:branched-chain amino acid transport system substrate-binding protein